MKRSKFSEEQIVSVLRQALNYRKAGAGAAGLN